VILVTLGSQRQAIPGVHQSCDEILFETNAPLVKAREPPAPPIHTSRDVKIYGGWLIKILTQLSLGFWRLPIVFAMDDGRPFEDPDDKEHLAFDRTSAQLSLPMCVISSHVWRPV